MADLTFVGVGGLLEKTETVSFHAECLTEKQFAAETTFRPANFKGGFPQEDISL